MVRKTFQITSTETGRKGVRRKHSNIWNWGFIHSIYISFDSIHLLEKLRFLGEHSMHMCQH